MKKFVVFFMGVFWSFFLFANPSSVTEKMDLESITPKILGGKSVPSSTLPWQSYLMTSWNGNVYRCGGVLIDKNWVLTAAHCLVDEKLGEIQRSDLSVWVGITNRSEAMDNNRQSVKNIFIHPEYDQTNLLHDLALIQIDGQSGTPIAILPDSEQRILTQNTATNWLIDHPIFQVSGWGLTNVDEVTSLAQTLQQTLLLSVPLVSCLEQWQDSGIDLTDHQIVCAVSPSEMARDTCSGDSGGPLVWQSPSNISDSDFGLRLVGVISFGLRCGDPDIAGIYTSVADYQDWIADISQLSLMDMPKSSFSQDPFVVFNTSTDTPDSGGNIGFIGLIVFIFMVYRRFFVIKIAKRIFP
jgi:secreted trypsin-like serine protease